jgi:predicted MFS family arabinose efflux permease
MRSFAQVMYTPSLVTMRDDLATTTAMVGLTISVYGLVLAFAQIAYGPIVDRFDSKRVLISSMSIFTLASLGGFFTQGVPQLLFIRAFQAIGIAAAASVGIALITDLYPRSEQGKAMGVFEVFNAAGAASGPLIGAAIAIAFSWRVDFLALAMVGLAVILFSLWQLPPQPAHAQKVGLTDLLLIARTPPTGGTLVLGFVQFYALYTLHTLTPLLLTDHFNQNEGGIGVMLAVLPIGAIIGSSIGGRTSDRKGSRATLLFGSTGTVIGMGALTYLSVVAGPSISLLTVGLCVIGLGFSIGICLPVQIKVMVGYFSVMRASAGSLLYFARFLGATVAPVLVGYLADDISLTAGFGSATILLTIGVLFTFMVISDPAPVPVAANPS